MGASASARQRWRMVAARAVTIVANGTLGEAQREAPIEEGTLRASGEVELEVHPTEVIATLSFNEVYAARQHEETEWHHPIGGNAKYLEGPVKRNAPKLERALELELRREGLA